MSGTINRHFEPNFALANRAEERLNENSESESNKFSHDVCFSVFCW